MVGLLAAAIGRRRDQPIDDLAGTLVAVRTDRAGIMLRDYHTASDYRGVGLPTTATKASGEQTRRADTVKPTTRYYLCDAVFVVTVHHRDGDLLDRLAHSVRRPALPLSLGRRSCPPTAPLHLPGPSGPLWDGDHLDVTATVPYQAPARSPDPDASVTLPVVADDPDGTDRADDQPTTFSWAPSRHSSRPVTRTFVTLPADPTVPTSDLSLDRGHDPFSLLG